VTKNRHTKTKALKQSNVDFLGLKRLRKASQKAGLSPGTLVQPEDKPAEKAVVTIINYNADDVTETVVDSIENQDAFKDSQTVTWINVEGLKDIELIGQIGKIFDIHPLILEDIVHTGHRPKIEAYDDHLFMVLNSLRYDMEADAIREEQVSIITGQNYLITFQEKPRELFKSVVGRIKNRKLRISKLKSDYLTYALMDTVVDHNFAILEILGEKLEKLDDILLENVTQEHIQAVFAVKKKVFSMRKSIWPIREIAGAFLKNDFDLIGEGTLIYFRDVNDHINQITDVMETYREVVSSMIDTYLSSLSLKMNEVMKVLTIAAAIFMPLTFIAGIYGMNFKYMPELEWKWGYFVVWGTMIGLGGLMLWLFRRKKWL